ncbi:LysM peptidoglycan-binding domain-containing protein [Methylobacterium terricola]|uniref:LysM peptidoglycan-binding domain-containing protein n=1 Tax=Methylobacterium terricola TaxID=2583531 RepID=A0A5C4LNR8_9HYPH|nr:LysM peptidoglycan-binding domain-containing protein [Methylobacterium terricola]TNC16028.1 LysM peptidoglycan-binding domain-containing protein [Methylobacterium terricola]
MTTELPTTELRRGLVLASVGLVAGFVLIGVAASGTRLFSLSAPEDPHPATVHSSTPAPTPAPPPAGPTPAAPAPLAALPAAPQATRTEPTGMPSFDVIRVEPDGASVVAGRGRPGAEIEVLRDDGPFARAKADESGNFAVVPPALPPGSHEITLRSTGPDGSTVSGPASAVVVVAQDRRTKPLVAVTAPGRPTAVLSLPEPVKPPAGDAKPPAGDTRLAARDPKPDLKSPADNARPQGRTRAQAAERADAKPDAPQPGSAPVKVVGVDAEAGGRLYVTAQGAPKADMRLYLNDTLVAPGQAGPDGRVAFTIGRGVAPGDYRVRVDQVDPASGAVKTRAETAFAVPPNLGAAPAEVPGRPSPTRAGPDRASAAPPNAGVPAASVAPAATAAAPGPARAPGAEAALAATDPAATDPGTVFVPGISTATVTRGDNLWSISRKTYGRGLRYTVIFDANQGQIRDPNRIYPGQVFVLPGDAPLGQRPVPGSPG